MTPDQPQATLRPKRMLTFYVGTGVALALFVGGWFAWTPLRAWYQVRQLRRDADTKDRSAVVEDLVRTGTPAVPALVSALKDGDASAREHAALALGEIEDRRVVAPLIEALKDPNSTVRARAAMALAKIRDPRAVPSLVRLLGDVKSSDAAISSLMFHDDVAVVPLLRALGDKDPAIRRGAYYSLVDIATEEEMGPFPFDPSAPAEKRSAQAAAIEAYFRKKRPEVFAAGGQP